MKTSKEKCHCQGAYVFVRRCGAYVCERCGAHQRLVNCYCGWSADGSDGYRNLVLDGETIESEDY